MANRLTVEQFAVLFNILDNKSLRDKEFVESLFRKNSENFSETFNFLKQIKAVDENQGKITISRKLSHSLKVYREIIDHKKTDWISEYLINALLHHKSYASSDLIEYLHNFHFDTDLFTYRPTSSENIRFADIRNFLIDLGLVEYSTENKLYVFLRPALLDELEDIDKSISSTTFEKIQKAKKELGDKAELVALKHEQDRLIHLPDIVENIIHVAKKKVNAGYDIESFTELNNGRCAQRLIEVKAVLISNPRFFWSRNEIEKAKKFKDTYWLYLVPYTSKQEFNIDSIDKISDPYLKVFLTENTWNKKIELYSFSK